MIVFTGIVTK